MVLTSQVDEIVVARPTQSRGQESDPLGAPPQCGHHTGRVARLRAGLQWRPAAALPSGSTLSEDCRRTSFLMKTAPLASPVRAPSLLTTGATLAVARDGLHIVRVRPFNHTGRGQTDTVRC